MSLISNTHTFVITFFPFISICVNSINTKVTLIQEDVYLL